MANQKFKLAGKGTDKNFQKFLSESGVDNKVMTIENHTDQEYIEVSQQETKDKHAEVTINNETGSSPAGVFSPPIQPPKPDKKPDMGNILGGVGYDQIDHMLQNMPSTQAVNQRLSQQAIEIKGIKDALGTAIKTIIDANKSQVAQVNQLTEEVNQIKETISQFATYFQATQAPQEALQPNNGKGHAQELQQFQEPSQQPQPQNKLAQLAQFGPALAQLLPMFQGPAAPPVPVDPMASPAFQAAIQIMTLMNQQRREGNSEFIEMAKGLKTLKEVIQ